MTLNKTVVLAAVLSILSILLLPFVGCRDQDVGFYKILNMEGCASADRVDTLEVVSRNCQTGEVEIYRPRDETIEVSWENAKQFCSHKIGEQYHYGYYGERVFSHDITHSFPDPSTVACPEYVPPQE